MSYKISKGKTEFLRAMSTSLDIEAFFKDYSVNTNEMIGVAFIGRSNVGKSSLINALFGKEVARVSKTPGRTQQINLFQFEVKNEQQTQNFFLFDLPGYGHAKVAKNMLKNWQEIIGLFFSMASNSVVFVAIQDARHPGQEVDFLLFKYLAKIRPIIILALNKIDKLKSQKERAALKKCIPTLSKDFKLAKQFYLVSAEKKEGLELLENGIMSALGL